VVRVCILIGLPIDNRSQVILANSLRDGAVTALQLLHSPVAVEAIFYEPLLFHSGEESTGSSDAEIAIWYIAASLFTAADAELRLSSSCADDIPASVGALAMQLALSQSLLSALCGHRGHPQNVQSYIKAAASSAFKVIAATACSALAMQALDLHHPWVFGSDNIQRAVSCTGHTPKQLLSNAQQQLRSFTVAEAE
jgi:hypothetical protein